MKKSMNNVAENDTLNWYRDNLENFIARTADVDMTALYSAFLAHVPSGGRILDLGCGAGSAALHFARNGYDVLAIDGCMDLCEYTFRRVGCPVRCLRFAPCPARKRNFSSLCRASGSRQRSRFPLTGEKRTGQPERCSSPPTAFPGSRYSR